MWLGIVMITGSLLSSICMARTISKRIMIAATEWPPFTSDEVSEKGFLSDLTKAAFRKSGYDSEVRILPWKRAFEMTKNGHFDCLLGTSYLSERENFFFYSKYGWDTEHFFFANDTRRSRRYIEVKDLCPARIGELRGSYHLGALNQIECLSVQENTSIRQNIQMLIHGRVDLIISLPDVMDYYLNNHFPEARKTIFALSPSFAKDRAFLAFPKKLVGSEKLMKEFDRGVYLIKSDGSYEAILRKHGINRQSVAD